jgi:PAS domain S-box-containing protein
LVLRDRLKGILKNAATVVLLTAGATGLRYCFPAALGSRVPFLLYTLAVAVVAQIAGTISGLIVTGLAIVLIGSAAPASDVYMDTVLALFGVVGVALSMFGGWRKRLQDDLRRAHERLALKHQIARMGSYEWMAPVNRFVWSPELEEICGVRGSSHDQGIEGLTSLIHPDDKSQAIAGLQGTGAQTSEQTYRIIRPDGQVRWVHSRRKYRYDAQGNPVHVLGVVVDVTDVKRGEMAQQILSGLVQVCSSCRRIQDNDQWYSMEGYLRRHTAAKFSHGMCPDCGEQWFPEAGTKAEGEQGSGKSASGGR